MPLLGSSKLERFKEFLTKSSGRQGQSRPATAAMTDFERAERLWAQYGRPRIILSFGARGGGAEFALWLHAQILRRKGLRDTEVYLDTVAMLKEGIGETHLKLAGTGTAGIYKAYNPAWRGYFEYALYHASVMVFIVTQEWYESPNCREEHAWFIKLNDMTPNSLHGISLVMEDDALSSDKPAPVNALPNTIPLHAKRQWVVSDATQRRKLTGNQKNLWVIDEVDLNRLLGRL